MQRETEASKDRGAECSREEWRPGQRQRQGEDARGGRGVQTQPHGERREGGGEGGRQRGEDERHMHRQRETHRHRETQREAERCRGEGARPVPTEGAPGRSHSPRSGQWPVCPLARAASSVSGAPLRSLNSSLLPAELSPSAPCALQVGPSAVPPPAAPGPTRRSSRELTVGSVEGRGILVQSEKVRKE